jgi:hypothetical protein
VSSMSVFKPVVMGYGNDIGVFEGGGFRSHNINTKRIDCKVSVLG